MMLQMIYKNRDLSKSYYFFWKSITFIITHIITCNFLISSLYYDIITTISQQPDNTVRTLFIQTSITTTV